MTKIERLSDNVYVFTSDRYAQVTAGVVLTPDGAIVIDTLPYEDETRDMREFIERKLGSVVRYVVNTHHHADHVFGTWIFGGAQVVAHALCAELLHTRTREGLKRAQQDSPDMAKVHIVLPQVTFRTSQFRLTLGGKTLILTHSPGHSPDLVTVLVNEDRVLFASDTVMSIPVIAGTGGSLKNLLGSLQDVVLTDVEMLVQGHGDVILRGEIRESVRGQIRYLQTIDAHVRRTLKRRLSKETLANYLLASTNLVKVQMGGLADNLHQTNVNALYDQLRRSVRPYPSTPRTRPAAAPKPRLRKPPAAKRSSPVRKAARPAPKPAARTAKRKVVQPKAKSKPVKTKKELSKADKKLKHKREKSARKAAKAKKSK